MIVSKVTGIAYAERKTAITHRLAIHEIASGVDDAQEVRARMGRGSGRPPSPRSHHLRTRGQNMRMSSAIRKRAADQDHATAHG